MNEFAKFLDKKMNERNITARELSEDLKVSQSYVYNWLKSERIPSDKKNYHLDMIAKALHLSLKELRELKESYFLAKDVFGLEKKNLILEMPVENYLRGLDININKKNINEEGYKLIHKNEIKDFIEIIFGDINSFSNDDEVYISCQEIFDDRYFDIFFSALKRIFDKSVKVIHILPLKKDELHNIKILKKVLALYFEGKGNYITRYVTNYETVMFPIVYTKKYTAMFFNREVLIYNDKKINKLLKYEFESCINNTLIFIDEFKNDFFEKKLPNILSSKGDVYLNLGYRHYDLLNGVLKKNKVKANLYNIFYETELMDVDSVDLQKELENSEFKNNKVLVIDERECPIYSVVKGNELILIFYINNKQMILSISERLIVNSFENFFSRIVYKYSDL